MKSSLRKKLDLIPLLGLVISAFYLLWIVIGSEVVFQARHIVGIAMLFATVMAFLKNHKWGIISLGVTLILGLFGLLSFSPAIITITFGERSGESKISPLFFQPIFVLWLTLHLLFSFRYYDGIATKRYWNNINSDEPIKID